MTIYESRVPKYLKQDSRSYDYARYEISDFQIARSPVYPEGHYEFDACNDDPYWEPANAEDELKNQLIDITLVEEDLM